MGSHFDPDIFRILVATDNHLGYQEKDAERGNDSFNTFEEVLELAVEKEVDFILLGGDLFHENKPSRNSLLHCMQLLRKYTFGNKPIYFDFVSDPTENFPHLKNPSVNYQDPNLNVSVPVFSIHGNHDDPSGLGHHSPLDMLSTAGLINYFGRASNLSEIKISPLLLTKGHTKLAIYGLSAIKDERLFRLFKENKVKMLRPKEDLNDWFNIFVLHQNHTKHSLSNYIPEQFLDSFLHLVIWGHEHECLIEPRMTDGGFFVTQPGSSVATSLCGGEAVEKKVGLLEINPEKHMRITGLKLRTVRPFVFEDLILKDHDLPPATKNQQSNPVENFVEEHVNGMIEKAKEQLTGHPRQPKKPLIRLRIEYTDESEMFNVIRFGYKFTESVANPNDMILFKKFKKEVKKDTTSDFDNEAMDSVFDNQDTNVKVEDLVKKYFAELEDDNHQLQLLSERGLAHAVSHYVEKDDHDAINAMFMHQINKTINHLTSLDIEFEEGLEEAKIEEEIDNFRQQRLTSKGKQEEEDSWMRQGCACPVRWLFGMLIRIAGALVIGPASLIARLAEGILVAALAVACCSSSSTTSTSSTRGRGGRGSRGSRRPRGNSAGSARGSRGAANKTTLEFEENDDYLPPTRGRGRGRGKGSTTSSSTSVQPTINSFLRSSQRTGASSASQRKGAIFDSDSD